MAQRRSCGLLIEVNVSSGRAQSLGVWSRHLMVHYPCSNRGCSMGQILHGRASLRLALWPNCHQQATVEQSEGFRKLARRSKRQRPRRPPPRRICAGNGSYRLLPYRNLPVRKRPNSGHFFWWTGWEYAVRDMCSFCAQRRSLCLTSLAPPRAGINSARGRRAVPFLEPLRSVSR